MARKSTRLSEGPKTHKRNASATMPLSSDAKRSKTAKSTPTKSQYFHPEESGGDKVSDDDVSMDDDDDDDDDAASEFDEDRGVDESSDAEEDQDDYNSEEETKSRSKPRTLKGPKTTVAQRSKTGESAVLEPGTQVIIKKLKARPAGKTPYSDDKIHPNTLLFLKDLAANNNREWLKINDAEFRQAEKDWHSFVEKLTERLVEIDDSVPELPVKDVVRQALSTIGMV
ncbi:hypothetical protein LTR56_018539 [Elasticomyces elasticus]|nr:hypothetical protein LTR56_018539 [Elasticomyces elasticus]KAK3660232.1 hypothetical protein LTR22_008057 [Elasticomyces elasticus]KAK4933696.1 hypothetical protein LTR49_000161 [Elasticomyces elasticus]KAK5761613.1 hypothetical protein LTS12_008217 [Elasticomyces elasticus]